MTNSEIIKNTRCCADSYCKGCTLLGKEHCRETLASYAWNLMSDQQRILEKAYALIGRMRE